MKVKLFVGDKATSFGRWKGFVAGLEETINTWLAANAGIKIQHITQSSNSLDPSKMILSVWYEEASKSTQS